MAALSPAALQRAVPLVFVLIWSTGFVVARYGMPHAGPMDFLALRFLFSALLFLAWVRLSGAAWPQGGAQWGHLAVTGVLMHAGYLGGVWAAVKLGLGAGLVSLIVGLQPVLTALWLSAMAGHGAGSAARVRPVQWLGLALGLAGLLLVVWHKLHLGQARPENLALAVLALGAITAGTLYQKRWVAPCDVRSASAVQLLAALAVTAPLAWIESYAFDWHPQLIGALAWSVLVLTLGGSSLLYLLIQRGAATAVTSLMYLVPPCTAVLAWCLFDELLTPLSLAGLACTAVGVALVVRDPAPARA
ncbi:DMT family transporter [Rubrivivax rivuli]|uniref:DMT family transporter n=1 Tax=Rubrivivax rivuli TaxID=1862385 RepID=A0A437REY4_9BURK|nr:DMT family transporter [Rubrivivax rivuli]RVU45326.1 DMT family transporter [Rubrivivax rivuli]